jgi:hypothetical protein
MDLARIVLEAGNVEARSIACLAGLTPHGADESLRLCRILAQQLGQAVYELQKQAEVNAHLIRLVDRMEWRLAALESIQKGVVPS